MMQLNEAQRRAVCHTNGPMLVLAGPGSGKTRVITERVGYLVNHEKIAPERILVVTFTRAAAVEMQHRYLSGGGATGVTFGTFHSIFFYILKRAYGYTTADIISEEARTAFVSNLLAKGQSDMISDILNEISKVKSERYDIDSYFPLSCSVEEFRNIYKKYGAYLKHEHKIDFDDMMIYTYELFAARKDILSNWQKRFEYILVDEFQDINRLQYDIVRMLAGKADNLFVVGDDDQSIYGFRGSDPSFMLNFPNDNPGTKQVLLDINYRCSGNIVKAAAGLISHNKKRFDKKIVASNEAGEPVFIKECADVKDENLYIIKTIRELKNRGVSLDEMAVLYRTNFQPQALLYACNEHNIPVRLKEGVPDIYDHRVAKDIFAYIGLALGRRERELFARIANKPNRYISNDVLCDRYTDFHELLKIYEEKPWMCDRIEQLMSDLNELAGMTPRRALVYIDKVIGYGDYLAAYSDEKRIPLAELRDIYEQILAHASEFRTYKEWFDSIEEFKSGSNTAETSEAVSFMTLHGAKGLEFDVVFIIDINEDIIPYTLSGGANDIEEERRMFYVGMTRARKKLYLLYTKSRYNHENKPSYFLNEIDKSACANHHSPSSHSIHPLP